MAEDQLMIKIDDCGNIDYYYISKHRFGGAFLFTHFWEVIPSEYL